MTERVLLFRFITIRSGDCSSFQIQLFRHYLFSRYILGYKHLFDAG